MKRMEHGSVPMKVNDHRKLHPSIYNTKAGSTEIITIPKLQYITYNGKEQLNWMGRPERCWAIWKTVNQLKGMTLMLG